MSGISKAGFRRLNLLLSGLHLAQAVTIIYFAKAFSLPVTGSYLAYDQASQRLMPAGKTLFELSFVWLIAAFFFIAAAAYFLNATLNWRRYSQELDHGLNRLRWLQYGLCAAIMMVLIAMVVGIYDIGSLAMIGGLTALMCLLGLTAELRNQTRKQISWLPYWLGTAAGLIPWLVIGYYLRLGAEQGSGAPTFVYFIYVSTLLIFSAFAINMLLHYRQIGRWKDYLFTEKIYLWLGLTAKSALAWQVFAGLLR